ncbi:TetR family transcriptional regulator [Xenorhabdus mauleonii]|uniref:TetR family transcriptional regulator n=1 Tax=Xenorhabdus mauleonii TaxID=351675 RepID=A0A1I3X7N6_9GAMM|nr:TetR/AcrR family transcriptional regulator [Xenorhabdus mauleonii]PHM46324.1 TetR family transcriptional regulator [Xenorhabdus mauleonii]SFK15299.1 transcriptional regulator, TetR family [Xenorhabdus mauleonii]
MTLRGRPPRFNRDIALQQAMKLFWDKGYEGTQLVDLTATMGINPPSFYAAFGSKKKAFYAAVELYIKTVGTKVVDKLNEAGSVQENMRAMLENSVEIATSSHSGGCLLILGIMNNLQENEEVYTYLKGVRKNTLALIRTRLEKGVADGEIPADIDVGKLALYFLGIMQAISLQARDGASKEELMDLIPPSMAAIMF